MKKIIQNLFFILVCLSTTAALWVFKDLLFPYVTSKAFFFRICVELAVPFYSYLLMADKKLRPNLKNPLNILVLLFLTINLISSFSGVNVVRSLGGNFERMGGTFYLAHLVALYFFVVALGQMQSFYLIRFLKFLLFMSLVIAGNGIFGWLHLPTLVQDPSLPVRVSSTLGNPIYLGSYLIIGLYLAIFFALQAESLPKRLGYYLLGFIFLTGIFLSGTRGAVVGIIVGSFIAAITYLFFTKSQKLRVYGFVLVAVFIASCAVLFSFSNKLPQGSTVQRLFKLKDSNTEARLVQWGIAIKGYKDHPIFGVGPENYYIIANKYYNPEIFQYDRSWFDKPHNYLLEILVTDGIFGLIIYLGILGFSILAFYKGYKAGFYSLVEFSVLLAALLVYQVQNLTVFDTVPASLMFYSFMGFAGYIWESSKAIGVVKKEVPVNSLSNEPFSWTVFGISSVVVAYVIFVGNVIPLVIAKNVNYGYAYASADPNKADGYFQTAISQPFNFDKTQTASKYSEFAQNLVRSAFSGAGSRELAGKVLDESINYLQETLKEQFNDPILWQRLSNLYLFKSVQVGSRVMVNPVATEYLNKAIALAPEREENFMSQVQIQLLNGDTPRAQVILEQSEIKFPTDLNIKAQLAQVYHLEGNNERGAQIIKDALKAGYNFNSAAEIAWLVDFYSGKKLYTEAINLQEQAVKLDSNNVAQFVILAKLYAQAGRKEEAINLAKEIMQVDSTQKKAMQDIIDSLAK